MDKFIPTGLEIFPVLPSDPPTWLPTAGMAFSKSMLDFLRVWISGSGGGVVFGEFWRSWDTTQGFGRPAG